MRLRRSRTPLAEGDELEVVPAVPLTDSEKIDQIRTTILGVPLAVRTIKYLVYVLFILAVGGFLRGESVQNAADESRHASEKASKDLKDAIDAQSNSSFDFEKFNKSLDASIRAECLLDNQINGADRDCGEAPK